LCVIADLNLITELDFTIVGLDFACQNSQKRSFAADSFDNNLGFAPCVLSG